VRLRSILESRRRSPFQENALVAVRKLVTEMLEGSAPQ
jgi:hypothetical protein